jgi:hypothetical protein
MKKTIGLTKDLVAQRKKEAAEKAKEAKTNANENGAGKQ